MASGTRPPPEQARRAPASASRASRRSRPRARTAGRRSTLRSRCVCPASERASRPRWGGSSWRRRSRGAWASRWSIDRSTPARRHGSSRTRGGAEDSIASRRSRASSGASERGPRRRAAFRSRLTICGRPPQRRPSWRKARRCARGSRSSGVTATSRAVSGTTPSRTRWRPPRRVFVMRCRRSCHGAPGSTPWSRRELSRGSCAIGGWTHPPGRGRQHRR